ncbi:MAG TPA: glycosyltransferase [Methylibium sp.]|uniref:CgeB family protein n=1 Tax=Methylibium sp. TaxID=2067992 RepID=UPI002DBAFFC7|nr:glycosyltransferase [Methylibium sp.]HEU4459923.1 glycosyltransferase [Methylibium sp.]
MKILYLGDFDPRQTSRHVGEALQRLGHTLEVRDPAAELGMKTQSRWLGALHYRSGYRLLQPRVLRWVRSLDLAAIRPDVVWVDGGDLLGRAALRVLKRAGAPVVLRSNDDPTGPRDARRFATLRRALPEYDLVAVHARERVPQAEYRAFGVERVLPIVMGYDEVHHRPFETRDAIDPALRSQVAFVGTWIPGDARDDFVCRLLELGVPVTVWGNNWHKAPRWAEVKPHWRGPALSGRDYVGALQGAELVLGLLSHGNRDGHTQRSNEVPYCGGLLCAERSGEHLSMFRDGEEAVFWTDADDCAAQCKRLLADDALRARIRAAGMRRVRANRVGNEDVARLILETLADAGKPAPSPFEPRLPAAAASH